MRRNRKDRVDEGVQKRKLGIPTNLSSNRSFCFSKGISSNYFTVGRLGALGPKRADVTQLFGFLSNSIFWLIFIIVLCNKIGTTGHKS